MGTSIKPEQFLVIVGAAKCGTTSLFDYLGQHPAICPTRVKEPGFFTEHHYVPPLARRGVRDYEDFWPDFNPDVHKYALEGSTGYTKWPEEVGVADRMRRYGMQPRLIYLVRDPIERIESHFNYMTSRNAGGRLSVDDQYLIDISRYSAQIAPYVEAFGKQSIRVIDFSRLRSEPDSVCQELYSWLGLDPHVLVDPGISNQTATLQVSRLSRVVTLRRLAWHLPRSVRRVGKRMSMKWAPYNHHLVRLPPDRIKEIRELLSEDMSKLARDWDIDVTKWGFGDTV